MTPIVSKLAKSSPAMVGMGILPFWKMAAAMGRQRPMTAPPKAMAGAIHHSGKLFTSGLTRYSVVIRPIREVTSKTGVDKMYDTVPPWS